MADRLERYREMRNFGITPEPRGRQIVAKKSALPTNMPEGLGFNAIAGLPQTATPAPLMIVAGVLTLVLALMIHLAKRRRFVAGSRRNRPRPQNKES